MADLRGTAAVSTIIGVRERVTATLAGFVTSSVTVLWLLQDNLRAKFGPIDDHEILAWLQGRTRLPIGRTPLLGPG